MKRAIPFLSIVLFSFLCIEGLRYVQFLRAAEESSRDLRIRFFSPQTKVHPDIVLVVLDDETMQRLPYRSPVPRDFLRDLHTHIAAARPRLIAYDVFFKDPSFSAADERFASALREHPPYAVSLGRDNPSGMVTEDPPLELFRAELAGVGLADLPLNPFSLVVRKARVGYVTPNGWRPTFVSELYRAFYGTADQYPSINKHVVKMFGEWLFPIDDGSGSFVIRYVAPKKSENDRPSFPQFSAYLVASGAIPSEWLADKIVIVGATFTDAQDLFTTPFYSSSYGYHRVPGVEIHAQILNSVLTGQYFGVFSAAQERLLVVVFVFFTIALAFGGRSSRLIVALPLALGFLCAGSLLAMRKYGVFVPMVMPGLGIAVAYGLSLGWRTVTEGRQRRWLKSTFSKYVAPSVVDELLKHPERVSLGGELRTITCLFTDIADFTTMSERLPPEQVVAFLNDYLGVLSAAILRYQGTIDKYVGDSIVAIFGAPLSIKNHAVLAVKAAIAIQEANQLVSSRWAEIMGRSIVTRIGVHSGNAVVGNIGSEARFDYTAIGDTVNTASRLEGINKVYGTRIILSEATKILLPNEMRVKPLGQTELKGRNGRMSIYEAVLT